MPEEDLKIVYWRRWESTFKEPKTGTIKYLLLDRKDNGFSKCVRMINRRIYLNVKDTHEYFDSFKEL